MLRKSLLSILVCFAFTAFAQKKDILVGFQVPLEDNVYTFKTEVQNIHYLEYLHYVKEDSSAEFHESQMLSFDPQDTIYNEQNYFRNPKTRYYPLIYVKYEQAANYCQWLADVLRQKMKDDTKIDQEKYYLDARLPTIEEWIKMAIRYDYDLNETPWVKDLSQLLQDKAKLRTILNEDEFHLSSEKDKDKIQKYLEKNPIYILENVAYKGTKDYLKRALNKNKIWGRKDIKNLEKVPYDLRGNVSEMTSTKGIAKGGNWKTSPSEIGALDNLKYSKPSNAVGFRCVCEFQEK